MYRRYNLVAIFISIAIFVLFISIAIYWYNYTGVKGWHEFEKQIKSKHDFVNNINLLSTSPPYLYITFNLSRKIDIYEVDSLFDATIKYIDLEDTYNGLQQYQKNKFHGKFTSIHINLEYRKNGAKYIYSIFQVNEEDGEPLENNYETFFGLKTWYVDYNGQYIKKYKLN